MIERVRQVSRAAGFVSYTAVSIPAYLTALAAAPDAQREAVSDRWVRRWARTLLRMFAIEVVVDGVAPPATMGAGRGRLIVSNHRSAIDIGVMLATFGGTMVSRADLAGWPVVGAAARAVGTVFVDRASAKSGASTIRVIQKHLEQGKTIALFPEGTTFDGDEVRPFHGGAFVAAARAEAEILPVGIAYPKGSDAAFVDETFPQHLARLAAGGRTRMGVAVGTAFVAGKGARAKALSYRAHAEVSSLVGHARSLL